jgi:hypothetical protein
MYDNDFTTCPDDGKLCLPDCDERCADLALLPDDDDLFAYLGWFLFGSAFFLAAVFGAILIAGWLLLS